MRIKLTPAELDLAIQSLTNYAAILERDASGLGRLDHAEAYRRGEEPMEETAAVQRLIRVLKEF